eukprot:3723254-Prymnesium_polylepis.1
MSNNDKHTRKKRAGYRIMNTFADEGDQDIDNVTVFAAENGVRDLIGKDYFIPMLRLQHELYQGVLRNGFDKTATEFAIEFPPPAEEVGIDHWVSLFEIYNPRYDCGTRR